jgi:hypothetical protein
MRSERLIAAAVLAAALTAMAFVVFPAPANPPAAAAQGIDRHVEMTPEVRGILRRACYDCHSHETRWPWYSKVPPASWLVRADVENGRSALNFSDWPAQPGPELYRASGMLMAACAAVKSGTMPRPQYLLLHREARLSPQDVEQLCSWSAQQAARILAQNRKAQTASAE